MTVCIAAKPVSEPVSGHNPLLVGVFVLSHIRERCHHHHRLYRMQVILTSYQIKLIRLLSSRNDRSSSPHIHRNEICRPEIFFQQFET